MTIPSDRIATLLREIYPAEITPSIHARILKLLRDQSANPGFGENYFSERNITLITYGDALYNPDEAPLRTLYSFAKKHLKGTITTIHILPFYPYSSDDGFAVTDYYSVNPSLGSWVDIQAMRPDFRLMFDAVINHLSSKSDWFNAFLANKPDFSTLFITEDSKTDLRAVTRPRTTPLLTPFQKQDSSIVYVWTTFSADQIDLDYHDPNTLLRILEVLLFYIAQGADVLRLDAIAYLWKEVGTSCIHLPQTHVVIQLIRAVLDIVAPHVVLITETNVPHRENISYFGDHRFPEAQLVYNFTLPPLLLYTFQVGNASTLSAWVNTLGTPNEHTAFFNFTASHDGIGVRPLEGILTDDQIDELAKKVESSGGKVSYKTNPDGTRSPYELNITYVDAITDSRESLDLQVQRFLASQAIMLALAGVPAIYTHSLLGSRNDVDGMKRAGYPRAINRQKLRIDQLSSELDNPLSFRAQIFRGYMRLIQARIQSKAFHPHAGQRAFSFNQGSVFALERIAIDNSQRVLCLFNVTGITQVVTHIPNSQDLLSNDSFRDQITLMPYQVRWLQYSQN